MPGVGEDSERGVGEAVADGFGDGNEHVRPGPIEVDPVDVYPVDERRVHGSVGKRSFNGNVVGTLNKVRLSRVGDFNGEPVASDETSFGMEHVLHFRLGIRVGRRDAPNPRPCPVRACGRFEINGKLVFESVHGKGFERVFVFCIL